MSKTIPVEPGMVIAVVPGSDNTRYALWWLIDETPIAGMCVVPCGGFQVGARSGWSMPHTDREGERILLGRSETEPDPDVWRAFAMLRHGITLG